MRILICLIALLINLNINHSFRILVNTSYGLIKGSQDDYSTKFLGIPYSQAPVGKLRWKNPVQVNPWYPDVLNATSFKPACPQLNCSTRMPQESCPSQFSEDCLYLNIFVPNNATELKPVLLFIHGGNYQYQGASSILFDGRFMTNLSDSVLVTIQYRIGALGFLMTGTEPDQINGNFGILDQRMAIKWVKDNIQLFSGDPNKITLFGQSAGAESVSIHLLSLDMQNNFNNAIIQSSPMSIPFRNFEEATLLNSYFSELLNCPPRNVECLKNKTIEEILEAQVKVESKISSLKLLEFFETWLPWLDGNLIKGQLIEFEKWNLPSDFVFKSFIIGTLTEECYIYIYLGFTKPLNAEQYSELLLASFKQKFVQVLAKYPPDLSSKDQRNLMSVLATNWVFSCSSRRFLEKALEYSKNSTNKYYQYVFDFALDFQGWDNFTFCYNHSCHGTDMPYTFDSVDDRFTKDGKRLSRSHIQYWSNFARYSEPRFSYNLEWSEYKLNSKKFLRFKKDSNSVEQYYLSKECDFFDKIGYYH